MNNWTSNSKLTQSEVHVQKLASNQQHHKEQQAFAQTLKRDTDWMIVIFLKAIVHKRQLSSSGYPGQNVNKSRQKIIKWLKLRATDVT